MTLKLDRTFAQLRQKGEKALIAYIMAGDPSLPITEQLVVELEQAGADIIELGVQIGRASCRERVLQVV